ncbi:MAG: hypothetical protein AB7G06_02410 [Bdellovibrionales bacterium]
MTYAPLEVPENMLGNQQTVLVLRKPEKPRRNLIVVRSGGSNDHLKWLPFPEDRTWDLMEINFGTDKERVTNSPADWVVLGGLTKWHGFKLLMQEFPALEDTYDYYWMLDDDLVFQDARQLNAMFDVMQSANLLAGQPSLTPDSSNSFDIFYQCRAFILRYTNYIECMMPCFRRDALKAIKPSFDVGITGWGMDLIWWHMLGRPAQGFGIIDLIAVSHLRPMDEVNGGFYKYMRSLGINPRDEVNAALDYMKMPDVQINTLGGVPRVSVRNRATGQWSHNS